MAMKATQTSKAWTKPQLTRLGELKDVAGNTGSGGQQGNGKIS
jgi:hypothetical protein